jgi:hypothetical protein
MGGGHHDRDQAWDYENGFYLTSSPGRMGKALAQYEIFKQITDLPGSVMEFGVYKGTSMVRLLTFRHLLETPESRAVVGFDAFGEFPVSGDEDDRAFIDSFQLAGGPGYPQEEIEAYLDAKGFTNYELVAGDVTETLPRYLAERPATRVSLLHLDMDVYEPTRFVLEHLGPRLVRGAVVMIDDYTTVAGATRAADEFVTDRGLVIEKQSIAHIPSYFRIP